METILFQGDGYLSSMLIKFIDAKILLHGCYHIVFDHVLPPIIELHLMKRTSLS